MVAASSSSMQAVLLLPGTAPWADMDTDCLVHMFARLDLDDLAASAPLVCRGWRRAAADPSLWRALDLRRDYAERFMTWGALADAFHRRYGVARFSLPGFLRLCVWRARGQAQDVALPPLLLADDDGDDDDETTHEIDHISLECPRLRRLALPRLTAGDEARLPELVPRWPLLEHLELVAEANNNKRRPCSSFFPALAAQLARHCRGFASLKMASGTVVTAEDVAALAGLGSSTTTTGTRLRSLCLDGAYLPREHLLAILGACTGLREFTARGCVGFDGADDEVRRRGAHIRRFDVRGSTLVVEQQHHLGLLWIGGI